MPQITVFTPSYNRASTLPQCYAALLRQTCQDFEWLIVDDGSSDNTRELVQGWQKDNKIAIRYIYQENQGMHGAHNTGHAHLTTELCIGCDSDDYLYDRCIEQVLARWNARPDGAYAGVIGECRDQHGRTLAAIPSELEETTLYDLRYRHGIKGDFKFALRSDLLKREPYPMIEGEHYMAVGYKYFKLDQDFKLLVIHDTLCCQEYLPDGEVSGKVKRYVTAPRGFMHYRNEMMPLMHTFRLRWWEATHYVAEAIFAKDWHFLRKAHCKGAVLLAIPSGLALNLIMRRRYRQWLAARTNNKG